MPHHYVLKSIILPIIIIIIIETTLKGIALYKAGRRGDIVWFICILIINSCGLLPIIYLLITNIKEENSKEHLELSTKKEVTKDNKNTKVKPTKKTTKKGGIKSGENVTPEKKQKETQSVSGKKKQKISTKKK